MGAAMRDGAAIADRLGGHRYAKGWMFRCPVHEDRVASCSIRADDGLVTCFAGCPRPAVLAALDALGLTDDEKHVAQLDLRVARAIAQRKAQQMWEEAGQTPYDIECVAWYLRCRRITLPVPAALRRPTIFMNGFVARVQDGGGRTTAVHAKNLAGRRLTHGWLGDGAVRLASPADGALGLAEGVETAMSATQMHGMPCWAALGARRLYGVRLPAAATEVHLFPDNDDPGCEAARRAVTRYTGEGRRVLVHWPPEQDNDWNDTLRRLEGAK